MKKFHFTTGWFVIFILVLGIISPAFATGLQNDLYDKYVEIAKKVSEQYDAEITLEPFGTFDMQQAGTLKEFEDHLYAIGALITQEMTVTSTTAGNSCTGIAQADYGSAHMYVAVTGEFVTEYDLDRNSQVMVDAEFSTKSHSAGYTWTTSEENHTFYDGGKECVYAASGTIGLPGGGKWSNAEISVTFFCNAKGKITAGAG